MRDLVIRLFLGSPCIGLGVWFMLQPGDPYLNMLSVFPCLLAFGLITFPSSTTVAASLFQEFFMPDREAQPKPDTKRAETLRFHQRPDAALVEYERLLQLFPQDLDLWSKVFELSLVDLRDAEQAASLLREARATVPPEAHRKLQHLFRVQVRRYEERPREAMTG